MNEKKNRMKKNRMNDGLWMDEVHSSSLVQAGERKHFQKLQNSYLE